MQQSSVKVKHEQSLSGSEERHFGKHGNEYERDMYQVWKYMTPWLTVYVVGQDFQRTDCWRGSFHETEKEKDMLGLCSQYSGMWPTLTLTVRRVLGTTAVMLHSEQPRVAPILTPLEMTCVRVPWIWTEEPQVEMHYSREAGPEFSRVL